MLVYKKKERLRNRSVLFDAAKNLFQGLGDTDKNALKNRGIIFGNRGKHMFIFIKCEGDPCTSQEFN